MKINIGNVFLQSIEKLEDRQAKSSLGNRY